MGTLQEKLDEIDRSSIEAMAPRAGIAAGVLIAAIALGVGFVIYRRRRRRSLAARLQNALPDVGELRASLKRPLERAVKAL
jgi:sensor c-di-GMP phosphodiesterase-like protein